MLRSLLLKKLLSYGNAVLAICVVLLVTTQLLSLPSTHVDAREIVATEVDKSRVQIAEVGRRDTYNPIIDSEIFGSSAAGAPKPKKETPKPKPKPKETAPTTLPLKLIGTVVSVDDDPFGSAIIENRSGAVAKKTYFVGDEVMDDVFVQTIRRRMVLLDNKRANRLEELMLEEGDSKFRPVSRAAGKSRNDARGDLASRVRASRPAVQGANRIFTFNRQELIDELEAKYDDLASKVDVRLVKDANGNVQGVQASNLASTPLAGKFGFQEGDVVQSVNGQKVDSLDRVYDIVEQNRNASTFRVQLLRGGRPQVFTYHLR